MKTELMQLFLEVAECESFSKAAEKLYTTQSTISRRILEIEEELGCQLYTRSARGIELTLAGSVVRGHFQRIIKEWEMTQKELRSFSGSFRPRLTVGYSYVGQLQFMIRSFEQQNFTYRDADLMFQFADSEILLKKLKKGILDCVVLQRPSLNTSEDFNVARIKESSMGVIVSHQNPLADRKVIRIADLAGQTEVRTTGEKNYYSALDEAFFRVGMHPLQRFETNEASECRYLVKLKNYVCFNPDIYDNVEEDLVQLQLLDWSIDYDLVFVYRKDSANPIAQELYNLLVQSEIKKESSEKLHEH